MVKTPSEGLLLAQRNGYSQSGKLPKNLPQVKSAQIHILCFLLYSDFSDS